MSNWIAGFVFLVVLVVGWVATTRADEAAAFKFAGPQLAPSQLRMCVQKAIRDVESNGDYNAVGDNGKAWGAYQFHIARWLECCGENSEWGMRSTPHTRQDEVAETAMLKYHANALAKKQKSEAAVVTWMANYHNLGHGSTRKTRYVQKVIVQYLYHKERLKPTPVVGSIRAARSL